MSNDTNPSWQDLLDLVTQLNDSNYESASVQFGDVSVRLSNVAGFQDGGAAVSAPVAVPVAAAPVAVAPVVAAAAPVAPAPAAAPAAVVPAGDRIDAPMIGVFYRRPSPGAPAFIEPGDHVEAGTTIGIIEIMKLMNPITAGKAGVITAFLAEDAAAVEFGQALAMITADAS
jgi:acetyl-CoA carboxylase biotin carboxyl carrier protein